MPTPQRGSLEHAIADPLAGHRDQRRAAETPTAVPLRVPATAETTAITTSGSSLVRGSAETCRITGQVVFPDGTPAAGARVDWDAGRHPPPWPRDLTADEQGRFELTDEPGHHTIGARAKGSAWRSQSARDVIVATGEDLALGQLLVTPLGSIRGVVRSSGGEALRAHVEILEDRYHVDEKRWRRADADADGRFVLTSIDEGVVTLAVTAPGQLSARVPVALLGGTEAAVDVALVQGGLEGTVTNEAGALVAGAKVRWCQGRSVTGKAVTDANGKFVLVGVEAGPVCIEALTSKGGVTRVGFVTGEVRPDEVTRLDVVVGEAGRLECHVRTTTGHAFRGASVEISGPAPRDEVVWRSNTMSQRDDLCPGSYRVDVYRDEDQDVDGMFACREDVPVRRGEQTVDIEVPDDASIEGTLTGVDGRPIASYYVLAHWGKRCWCWSETDDAGAFSIGPLPAGRVTLVAGCRGEPVGDDLRALATIDLAPGDHGRRVVLEARPSGRIRGRLRGLANERLSGIQLALLSRDGREEGGGITGPRGEVTLDHLPPGTYSVSVREESLVLLAAELHATKATVSPVTIKVQEGGTTEIELIARPE